MGDIYYQLTNKRADERTISYAESHDQAMVGDQTIIFRLIGKEMYTSMQVVDENMVVDRGIALHKMIRLVSLATAGDGYLNFMGNEFGHPEWIDFPREGNEWSYHYARRQWELSDNKDLRYYQLNLFDKAMVRLISGSNILSHKPSVIIQNDSDQVLIFERGDLLFMFNFNPNNSYTEYGIETAAGKYKILLNSDDKEFGGFGRNDDSIPHFTQHENGINMLKLYLPNRSAIILKMV